MLADPGIKYQDDTVTLNGKDYPAIKARFNPGVGDADKDIYKMVIDPKTSQLYGLLGINPLSMILL